MSYVKLFCSILQSTIWCQDSDTKVVWITMLALADRDGFVAGTIPGLAKAAGVAVDKSRKAISKFLAPDPDSSSDEYGGRRIKKVDGGWELLNYQKYRHKLCIDEVRERARIRKQQQREREHTVTPLPCDSHTMSHDVPPCHAIAEEEEEGKGKEEEECKKQKEKTMRADAREKTKKVRKPTEHTDAIKWVCEDLGLAGNMVPLVSQVIAAERKRTGESPQSIAFHMIQQRKTYDAIPDIQYRYGIRKFYEEGIWNKPDLWNAHNNGNRSKPGAGMKNADELFQGPDDC